MQSTLSSLYFGHVSRQQGSKRSSRFKKQALNAASPQTDLIPSVNIIDYSQAETTLLKWLNQFIEHQKKSRLFSFLQVDRDTKPFINEFIALSDAVRHLVGKPDKTQAEIEALDLGILILQNPQYKIVDDTDGGFEYNRIDWDSIHKELLPEGKGFKFNYQYFWSAGRGRNSHSSWVTETDEKANQLTAQHLVSLNQGQTDHLKKYDRSYGAVLLRNIIKAHKINLALPTAPEMLYMLINYGQEKMLGMHRGVQQSFQKVGSQIEKMQKDIDETKQGLIEITQLMDFNFRHYAQYVEKRFTYIEHQMYEAQCRIAGTSPRSTHRPEKPANPRSEL